MTVARSGQLISGSLVASALAITTQPGGAVSGTPFTQQPVVEIRNAAGQLCYNFSGTAVAVLNAGSGTLGGTTSVAFVRGVATFTNLQVTGIDTYTLAFSVTQQGITGATSNAFSTNTEPQYIPGVSVPVFVADYNLKQQRSVELAAGQTTFRNGATFAVGDIIGNGTPVVASDILVDATDNTKISSVTLGFSVKNDFLGASIYVTNAGTGLTLGQFYVIAVDTVAKKCTMSSSYPGAPTAIGTVGAIGTAVYNNNNAGNYFEATGITTGVADTTGGPTASGTLAGVTWTKLTGFTTVRVVPGSQSPILTGEPVVPSMSKLVTGKGGAGKAVRVEYLVAVNALTDLAIDASDNTIMTTSQWPVGLPLDGLSFITITGGTGFTPKKVYVTKLSGFPGFTSVRFQCSASCGTIGSTAGVGTTGWDQQTKGDEWVVYNMTRPAVTKTVYFRMQQRLTLDPTYLDSAGLAIKYQRMPYTGNGQAVQWGTHSAAPCDSSVLPGYSSYWQIHWPDGSNSGTSTQLTPHATDASQVKPEGSKVIYPGQKVQITAGTGWTPGTYDAYPVTNSVQNGYVALGTIGPGPTYAFTPASVAPAGTANLGTGQWGPFYVPPAGKPPYDSSGTPPTDYPYYNDQGTQPNGPYVRDIASLTPSWHRFLFVYRPHSAIGTFDGIMQMWIDGSLVLNVQSNAVNVTPAGGTKQWCTREQFLNLPILCGAAGCNVGGDMTLPSPLTHPFYFDVNLGDGDPTNLDTWAIWTD